jgi:hypothetical protein
MAGRELREKSNQAAEEAVSNKINKPNEKPQLCLIY